MAVEGAAGGAWACKAGEKAPAPGWHAVRPLHRQWTDLQGCEQVPARRKQGEARQAQRGLSPIRAWHSGGLPRTCSTKAEEDRARAAPMTTASSTVRRLAREAGACSTFSKNCIHGGWLTGETSGGWWPRQMPPLGICLPCRIPAAPQFLAGVPSRRTPARQPASCCGAVGAAGSLLPGVPGLRAHRREPGSAGGQAQPRKGQRAD